MLNLKRYLKSFHLIYKWIFKNNGWCTIVLTITNLMCHTWHYQQPKKNLSCLHQSIFIIIINWCWLVYLSFVCNSYVPILTHLQLTIGSFATHMSMKNIIRPWRLWYKLNYFECVENSINLFFSLSNFWKSCLMCKNFCSLEGRILNRGPPNY